MKKQKTDIVSPELREDLVSGDWILIAPGRKKRPDQFVSKEDKEIPGPENCLFEDPQASGNGPAIIRLPENPKKDWEIQLIPNKYPAVSVDGTTSGKKVGPYLTVPAAGYHDVLITRDHYKNFSGLSAKSALDVFRVAQERYRDVAKDKRIAYVSIFHNWGAKAGASIYHPHYQMISIPVIPPDVDHSLSGSTRYFKKNKRCVHCDIVSFESKEKSRIILENEGAIVFAPYVSREPFEFRIFPKKHLPFFEDTSEADLRYVAEALRKSLSLLEKRFVNIDYNFFIHTAPTRNKGRYSHYHWHIEVQPKISIAAGFELSTGIEITVVDPDDAAAFIRTGKIGK